MNIEDNQLALLNVATSTPAAFDNTRAPAAGSNL